MPGHTQKGLAVVIALVVGATTAAEAVAGAGGAAAPGSGDGAGGAEYGTALRSGGPPRATRFSVSPTTVTAGGSPPAVVVRLVATDERVDARVVFTPAKGTRGGPVRITLGRVRVRRTIQVTWPKGVTLRSGRYTVRLHATDAAGNALVRRGKVTGRATLTVKPKPKPKPKPEPVTSPKPAPAAPAPPGSVPTASGGNGVFPVAGPSSYTDGFGAAREGYGHQGVDIAAASGTPVVAPTAGTVRFTDYQESAAGEYLVVRLADGRDVFLAHCIRQSTTVRPGQDVAAGQPLCRVGSTGRTSGPVLHFELWPQGWRDIAGTAPVDPMPQLRAWGR